VVNSFSVSAALTIRTIAAHERDAVLDLLNGWLDRSFFARYFDHDPTFRDDLCFVADDGGRLVSTLQVFRKQVRVDGAFVAVGGVGNVYTDPGYRDGGVASQLLTHAIAAMQEHEFDLSLLFASRTDFYGRLSWQSHLRYLSFIEAGDPSPPASASEPFDAGRDLDDVMALYDSHSGSIAGATVRDRAYWRGQLQYAGNPDERFVVARRDGRVIAYARSACSISPRSSSTGARRLAVALAVSLASFTAARCHLRARALADSEALLRDRGLTVQSVEDRSWMWRLLDPAKLAGRCVSPPPPFRRRAFSKSSFRRCRRVTGCPTGSDRPSNEQSA
jgi:GNAT superfamily N-acetyltransferase